MNDQRAEKTIEEVSSYFHNVRWIRRGQSFKCECPSHQSHGKQSLIVSYGKAGKIMLHDFGNCDTNTILQDAGLTWADINGQKSRPTWQEKTEEYMRYKAPTGNGKGYGPNTFIKALYHYTRADGSYIYTKARFEGTASGKKEIRYFVLDAAKENVVVYGKGGRKAELYRLPEALKAIKAGYPVYITEGEKDTETLRKLGRIATTPGGAEDWRPEFARYFKSADVVILRDNDKPGLELAEQIQKALKPFAYRTVIINPSSEAGGDITDYLESGGTLDGLDQMVAIAREDLEHNVQYAEWISVTVTKQGEVKTRVNSDLLAATYRKHEHYAIVRKGHDDKDDFYLYRGGYYQRSNKASLKAAIHEYVPLGMASDQMLNACAGLIMANEEHVVDFEELDADTRYINVRNGLVDFKTGKLEPHRPEVMCTRQLNVVYNEAAKEKPVFDKYISDLCRNELGQTDPERVAVIQEFLGLALTNIPMYYMKKALVLWSSMGDSGKSTLLRIFRDILGADNVTSVSLNQMDEGAANRFALGGLLTKRLIIIGDSSNQIVKSSNVFKKLTGGDSIESESKGKQSVSGIYNGGLLMACNGLPYFQDDSGKHVFNRMQIVPCEHSLEEDEKDATIENRVKAERAAVVNWFLEGARRLVANNYKLTRTLAGDEAIEEHRRTYDSLYRFVTSYYKITRNRADRISKPLMDAHYFQFCSINELVPVTKNNLRSRMASLGIPSGTGNIGENRGVSVYFGLKALEE